MASLKDELQKANQEEQKQEEKRQKKENDFIQLIDNFRESQVEPALREIYDALTETRFIDPNGDPCVGEGSKNSFVWRFTIYMPLTKNGVVTYSFEYPKKSLGSNKKRFDPDHMETLKKNHIVSIFKNAYIEAKKNR